MPKFSEDPSFDSPSSSSLPTDDGGYVSEISSSPSEPSNDDVFDRSARVSPSSFLLNRSEKPVMETGSWNLILEDERIGHEKRERRKRKNR